MERFAIKIDKSLRANLYKICRLCGIDNPDKIKVRDDANIVNLEDGEPELWKKVFDCIGLLITKDDKMPQFMCTLCVDKINDFFEFREMCYATDGQTRKLLGIKGEPKSKVQEIDPSSSIDFKFEDYKEPIPEVTPQRAGRKRRNADMEVTKDIKIDISDDIKPSTTNIATSATKKKRMKLSNTGETETKIEPGTKPAKKEPALKITPKSEPLSKIPLSKKRLKAEPIVKENKKEAKSTKLTKLMKKKLKMETGSEVLPETTKKKKVEHIKLKKLPQLLVKGEKLKKGVLDTKIKEETPVAILDSDPSNVSAAASSKTKPKYKEKCTICSEGFINKVHLDKHVKTAHIPTIQRYHCVQCDETLKKNMEIKNHNLWHKLSKTPFKCGKCSETSCSIYTYSKHIRDCNPIAYLDSHIPDWHCPDCSGNYETTYLFNIHSCVAKGLVCPGCEVSLKWKEDYFKHIPTCSEAFQRIPPYMTSNVQVKNEAELPTSPIPPLTAIALPATTISSVTVQSTSSTRVTPPQMDSNQCVVIPGNISLHEDAGASSPSKSSRKGKRITKKDLKRFDKLLKSTMTTLVSIKHEPPQGDDTSLADDGKPSSSELKEQHELPTSPLDSTCGSPMACGGDDFHHNGDDSESADEQIPEKPVGKIKQEIIDEGYRDLYNNIEVNIKHEIDANKNTAEESLHKRNAEAMNVPEESSLAPKPILKLKITKEHGTLNSVLMDSPKSEKKKKKKKRKEDRNKSPEKEERSVAMETPALPTADVPVNNAVEKDVFVEMNVAINQTSALESNKPVVSDTAEEPSMPLPEIINIKKEINVPEEGEVVEDAEAEASSQNTPSIVAASSGSLQISCVSEGVIFSRSDENEEAIPQETPYSAIEQASITSEEPANWVEPISSMELSLASKELTSPNVEDTPSIKFPMAQETQEEIDIKPRLEDLIPMLQIASVASGAEVFDKPIRKPIKRKRRQTTAKCDAVPKIVSVSSGNEAASYHPQSDDSSVEGEDFSKNIVESNENDFDFSQVSIKEEVVDPRYDEQQHDEGDEDEDEEEVEAEKEEARDDEEEEKMDEEEQDIEKDKQIDDPLISKKQAEENAYIANIDFNNLTIKQEKEYIDDGLENSAFEVGEDDDEEEESEDEEVEDESSDDSDEDSSDDDSNKSDSESEREYRELPSDNEEIDENDEQVSAVPPQMGTVPPAKEKETPTSHTQLGLQILAVHSEFVSPQSRKKTESEKMSSDDKLSLNSTTEQERETEKKVYNLNLKSSTSVKETDNCSEDHESLMQLNSEIQTESNYGKQMLENMDIHEQSAKQKMLETTCEIKKPLHEPSIIDGKSRQLKKSQIAETDSHGGSTEEASTSRKNSIDHCESSEVNLKSRKSSKNINKLSSISCEENLENTNLAKVCDDLECKVNEQFKNNPSSYNKEQSMSVEVPSQEAATTVSSFKIEMADNLNRSLYPGNANVFSTSRLLQGGIKCTNTDIPSVSTSQATIGLDMVPMDQCYNTALRSINKVSRLCVESFDETAGQNVTGHQDTAQKEMNVHTEDGGMLPNLTDFSRVRLTSQSLAHEPSAVRLLNTGASCLTPEADNLSELHPVNDVQENSQIIPSSVQSLIGSHLPSTQNSATNYSIGDHISYKDHNPPHSHSQNTLPTSLSVPANRTPNTNTLLDLGSAVGNAISNIDPPYNHDTRELNPSESVFNIPPSRMEFQQLSAPGSSYAAFNCNSDPSSFSDYLTPPTAGQLQTSLVQQPVVNESPELSSRSLTNLSVLSEEVQNLLNEDTVAINNFEFNDSVLRARSSVAPNNRAPIFNDFENLNEIAENNNNANIERELQDELGNVLADAIADRSNDDDVDDNNVMNENRANFDIT